MCHSLSLNLPFVANERSKNLSDGPGQARWLYFLLAQGARNKSKCDPQSAPAVLEKVDHTISVKDVPTREARASLSPELLRVADPAHRLIAYL